MNPVEGEGFHAESGRWASLLGSLKALLPSLLWVFIIFIVIRIIVNFIWYSDPRHCHLSEHSEPWWSYFYRCPADEWARAWAAGLPAGSSDCLWGSSLVQRGASVRPVFLPVRPTAGGHVWPRQRMLLWGGWSGWEYPDQHSHVLLCSDVLQWDGPIRFPQEYTPPAILGFNENTTTYFICDPISFCFCAPHTGFDWEWDNHFKSSGAFLSCGNRKVSFHLDYSSGTAAIRGTKELADGQHFWEVKMTSPVYGTDMVGITWCVAINRSALFSLICDPFPVLAEMVGIGTSEVNLEKFKYNFGSLLGHDEASWGLSYTGRWNISTVNSHLDSCLTSVGKQVNCFSKNVLLSSGQVICSTKVSKWSSHLSLAKAPLLEYIWTPGTGPWPSTRIATV